jgi:hypothetical protein
MDPARTLTRYCSFTKFASALAHGLFVPKATLFKDELEGVLLYFNDASTNQVIPRETIRKCLEWVYVSCWHAEPQESHAMWRIYGESNEAVAFQTTERKLRMAYFEAATGMHSYFDDIRYKHPEAADFRIAPAIEVLQKNTKPTHDEKATYAALFSFLKHSGYAFEKEARLVAIDLNATIEKINPSFGFAMPAAVTRELISDVILHPFAPKWFENLVMETVNQYGVTAKVRRSTLAEKR